jgi:hypothetical protein
MTPDAGSYRTKAAEMRRYAAEARDAGSRLQFLDIAEHTTSWPVGPRRALALLGRKRKEHPARALPRSRLPPCELQAASWPPRGNMATLEFVNAWVSEDGTCTVKDTGGKQVPLSATDLGALVNGVALRDAF